MELTAPVCSVDGVIEAALALVEASPGSRVLDLGCYEGATSHALIEMGYNVSSCDLLERPGVVDLPDFRMVNANYPLPYNDAEFDAIICTDVIEHLENPTLLLRECARILKEGGELVVSTPDVSNLISRVTYLFTGAPPTYHEHYFRNWGHISPVSTTWLRLTGERDGLRLVCTSAEQGRLGWKRRLMSGALWLPEKLFMGRKRELFTARSTVVARLVKSSGKPVST